MDTFIYDANGNTLTKTRPNGVTNFTYDIKNRLTNIAGPEGSESSTWGPDGSRVRMNNPTLNGDEQTIYDTAGNAVFGTGYGYIRVFGPGTDELLGEWKGNNSYRYYTHDALGSITTASDQTGQLSYRRTYRPFGQMTSTAAGNGGLNTRFGFTGRETSVGSTLQYRARQYDGGYGRFLQQDTFEGYESKPPSMHRYAAMTNNPVLYVDPRGESAIGDLATLGAGIVYGTF